MQSKKMLRCEPRVPCRPFSPKEAIFPKQTHFAPAGGGVRDGQEPLGRARRGESCDRIILRDAGPVDGFLWCSGGES